MKQYIVDAFTDKVFGGNQAAVCVLDEWISDSLMQNIARENNFSETAFTVKEGDKYHLRWFTPKLMCIESVMPSSHLILCRPFSSCPQSLPASESFPMSQLFA